MKRYLKKNASKLIIIGIYIIMFYVVANLLSNIFESMVIDEASAMLYTFIINLVIYIVLIASSVILVFPEIKTDFGVLERMDALKVFFMCLAGVGCVYFGNYIGSILTMIFGGGDQSANQAGIEAMMFSKYGFVMIIITVFIGPIVEELVFRKALHDALRNAKVPTALVLIISSVLFGFIHVSSAGDIVQVFPYIFMGVALGGLEMVSNNIYPSIIVHIFNNALATSMVFFMGIIDDYIKIM